MSLIKNPNELEIAGLVRALIYGQPGIGKSTLGLSSPKVLHLDFDRGVHRVNPVHLKPTVQIKAWEDVDAVLNEDLSAFNTLMIDTAGKMIEVMQEYIMRKDPRLKQGDGSLSLKGYGARKVMFKNFFARVSMLGKNIVFLAHDVEERDGDSRFVRPEIGGSSGNDLMKELDLVGYMQAVGKKRTISFNATEKYYGKNTCNLPDVMDVPDSFDSNNNFLSLIIAQYNDMIAKKQEMVRDYNMLLDVIEKNIEDIKTVEDMNRVMIWAKSEVKHIWDSNLHAAQRLRDKANALGFVFKRETSQYIDPNPQAQIAANEPVKEEKQTPAPEPNEPPPTVPAPRRRRAATPVAESPAPELPIASDFPGSVSGGD